MSKFLVILFLAVALVPAYPQSDSGSSAGQSGNTTRSVQGVVSDKSGAAIAGAVVQLKDTKTLQVRSFIAQQDGSYHFYGLSTDVNYEIRADHNGHSSPTKSISVFDSHRLITLNLKLKQ